MLRKAISRVIEGRDLCFEESRNIAVFLMSGEASDVLIAALLAGMRAKGETSEEMAGFATGLKDVSRKPDCELRHLADTCGTGGDRKATFNISTAAALIAAGAGVRIAKHGNRSVTSKCGSADVLEALGVAIDAGPDIVASSVERAGFGFCFAQKFHPAMKNVMKCRRELGMPTIFNSIGPLSNPFGVDYQILGVNCIKKGKPTADALARLGTKRAFVVFGCDGTDEITTTASNIVWELREGSVKRFFLDPRELGIKRVGREELSGGSADENAQIIRSIIGGEGGSKSDVAVLNAAALLVVAGASESMSEGMNAARASIASGSAEGVLKEAVAASNSHFIKDSMIGDRL